MGNRWLRTAGILVALALLAAYLLIPLDSGGKLALQPQLVGEDTARNTGVGEPVGKYSDVIRDAVYGESERVEGAVFNLSRVRVENTSHAPISDVAVYLRSRANWELVAYTDNNGEVVLPEIDGADYIVARHPDYALAQIDTAEYIERSRPIDGDREVVETITLIPGGAISGRVVLYPSLEPVGEGIIVYARDAANRSVSPSEATLARDSAPVLASTKTGPNGAFVIECLDSRREYMLAAATDGLYSGNSALVYAPGQSDIELKLKPLYTIWHVPQSPLGAMALPSDWADQFLSTQYMRIRNVTNAGWVMVPDSIANLAAGQGIEETHRRYFAVMQPRSPGQPISPLKIEFRFPGHEPLDLLVQPELLTRKTRSTIVELTPISGVSFLQLSVRAENAPFDLARACSSQFAGTLLLDSETGPAVSIGLTFGDLYKGTLVSGLIRKQYRAKFISSSGYLVLPSASDSGAGEWWQLGLHGDPSILLIDLSNASGIELEMLDPFGMPKRSSVGFRPFQIQATSTGDEKAINKGTINARGLNRLERAVALVQPGKYRIESIGPLISLIPPMEMGSEGGFLEPITTKLGPGETLHLLWQDL